MGGRREIGPFPEFQDLSAIDIATASDSDILERMNLMNRVLGSYGCCCNGHAKGKHRDEYWGADICELICRCTSHEITKIKNNDDGTPVTTKYNVAIDLSTLRVEVDENNEICCWLYDEPAV